MMKKYFPLLILIAILLISAEPSFAQCPMCRMAAESNLDHGGTEGRGLNTGILYLFSMPYIIAGVLGFIWWRNRNRQEDV